MIVDLLEDGDLSKKHFLFLVFLWGEEKSKLFVCTNTATNATQQEKTSH